MQKSFFSLKGHRSVSHPESPKAKGVLNKEACSGKTLRKQARATLVAAFEFHKNLGIAASSVQGKLIKSARSTYDSYYYYKYFLTTEELDSITDRFNLDATERRGVVELRDFLNGAKHYDGASLEAFCRKMQEFKGKSRRYNGLLELAKGFATCESRLKEVNCVKIERDESTEWIISPTAATGKAHASITTDGLMFTRPEVGRLKKALLKINVRRDWVASKCEDRLRAQYREALSHAPAKGKRLIVFSLASPQVRRHMPILDDRVRREEVMRFLVLNPDAEVYLHRDIDYTKSEVDAAMNELLSYFDDER